jgi:chromodomain-helicase-DNA-binding protein 7
MLKRYQNLRGPFLIVAPLSTIVNWQREIAAWTDMDVILYHGSNQDRELIRKLEFSYVSGKWKKSDGVKAEVVITSPETCMSIARKTGGGRKELATIDWEVIVVDEAHKLKNYDSKISQTLREEYSYRNSLLLTGTPLQNSTDELWTLLNFVDREAFNDRESFVMEFGSVKSTIQLEALHARLKPYLLRRDKDHVEKTVPPKEEVCSQI